MANTYLQMHIHKCFGALHLEWFNMYRATNV